MDGTKHRTWRSITDVAAECRIEWERWRRTQEAPAAAEDRNADSAAASSSFEPRSRAGGQRAFSRASNDSDPQPNAPRRIASLTKEEFRRECQLAGIATKIQGFSKKSHKCQAHVPMDELVHKLAVQRKSSLDRFFTRNAGPTSLEPSEVSTVSGFAKTTSGSASGSAWPRPAPWPRPASVWPLPAPRPRPRKRTATPSAKAATRKQMATPSAKAATRKRKATPSAKAATRKRMAMPSPMLCQE